MSGRKYTFYFWSLKERDFTQKIYLLTEWIPFCKYVYSQKVAPHTLRASDTWSNSKPEILPRVDHLDQ